MVEYALFDGLKPDCYFSLNHALYNRLCFSRVVNVSLQNVDV